MYFEPAISQKSKIIIYVIMCLIELSIVAE